MEQIAVLLTDQVFTRILQAELERQYQINSVVQKNVQDLLSVLEIIPFALVVCQEKIDNDSTAFRVCNFVQSNSLTIKVITIGKKSSGLKSEIAVDSGADPKKLAKRIAFLLEASSEDTPDLLPEKLNITIAPSVRSEPDEEDAPGEKTTVFRMPQLDKKILKASDAFKPFHIKYFLNMPADVAIPFPVFSKVKKNDDFEYHKKFDAGWAVTPEIHRQFELRTSKELFVAEADFQNAGKVLTDNFLKNLTNAQLTPMDRLALNSDGYDLLLEIFKHESFNIHTVEIIKEMVRSFDKSIKTPSGMELFKQMLAAKKISYAYAHIHLTCLSIFNFVDQFPWSKDQSKNKIIYLSLFHDLCLHNERTIRQHHRYNQEKTKLSEEIKNLMLNHSEIICNHLEKLVKAPQELTVLIREHHGVKNGKGFPENPGLSIAPLSMAFVVVEDFVTSYLDIFEKTDKEASREELDKIIVQLKSRYNQSTYKDIVNELQKLYS